MTTGIFTHLTCRHMRSCTNFTRRCVDLTCKSTLDRMELLWECTQIPLCNSDVGLGFCTMIVTKMDLSPGDNEKWQSIYVKLKLKCIFRSKISKYLLWLVYLFGQKLELPKSRNWNRTYFSAVAPPTLVFPKGREGLVRYWYFDWC